MLDNNVNNNQIPHKIVGNQQIPMEAGIAANPEMLQENIQDTYIANRVANTAEDPKAMMATAGLMVPTWLLITQSMDKFAKHSTGEYETTLQHKIGKFGDRIVDSYFAKSRFGQAFTKTYSAITNFVKTKIIDKSRILRAAVYTPSLAENHMARANQIGMEAMQLFDFSHPVESFTKPEKFIEDLDTYGATKEEIARFKSELAGITDKAARKNYILDKEFQTIMKNTIEPAEARRFANGFTTAADIGSKTKILNNLKALNLGFKDYAHLELCKTESHKHIDEIFEALNKANKKMFARDWGSNHNKLTQFCTKWFGREVHPSEIVNKLFAELQYRNLDKPENAKIKRVFENTGYINKLPKSKFARYLNHYTHLITEGATNRVAGGKAVALIQSWFIAEALYKAIKAEGGLGEKGRTFAERITELIAMLACIPLALKLMHSVGGLQYAGMTAEQVAKYRDNLKIHNDKAMKGEFISKDEWKASKKLLKDELNAGVKNPFVKLAKRIGRIVTVGLEQIRPYDAKDIGDIAKDGTKTYRKGIWAKIKDLFRHPKFGMKQMAGYPMRIGIGLMMIMPFLTKLAVKGCHMVFGKPKHSLLDEEKEQEMAEKQAELLKTQVPEQLQKTNAQVEQNSPVQYDENGKSTSNLLNDKNINQIKTTNTTETKKTNEPLRTYIPSPVGVKITAQEDLTPADAAMKRSEIAEQEALKALKMN